MIHIIVITMIIMIMIIIYHPHYMIINIIR